MSFVLFCFVFFGVLTAIKLIFRIMNFLFCFGVEFVVSTADGGFVSAVVVTFAATRTPGGDKNTLTASRRLQREREREAGRL